MTDLEEIRDRAKRGRTTLDDAEALLAELDAARAAVGEAWFAGGVTLAEAIRRKCRALEGDAEHWRRAAEARALRAEEGDHALHRFAALAAAKNEGRSAITLTVWSDGTVDADQYATLDGELDEWGTLHQERRASWGSRPIGEIDALVADLESDDWYTVEHRAPQDFWREIQALRARVAELERDAEEARTKALDEAIEWCRLTEAGDTNEDWQAAARCVRELVEKAKRGTGQDDDALRAEEGGE